MKKKILLLLGVQKSSLVVSYNVYNLGYKNLYDKMERRGGKNNSIQFSMG